MNSPSQFSSYLGSKLYVQKEKYIFIEFFFFYLKKLLYFLKSYFEILFRFRVIFKKPKRLQIYPVLQNASLNLIPLFDFIILNNYLKFVSNFKMYDQWVDSQFEIILFRDIFNISCKDDPMSIVTPCFKQLSEMAYKSVLRFMLI